MTADAAVMGRELQASGVGPCSPIASNKDEQGRAQNRRVELVEQQFVG